ncbi:receptor-like protein EIX2 [Neltuma alba]|uniref:receptor-like protein EIX2 n=1 Tax=Neltuma alba TaxID=207710 RepID=UPI0010A3439D|nr:receptor-like protein EIX2 [Prosopis alba]
MNSSYLQFIDFGQNNLTGKLPSWTGQYLHNLVGLRLQANRLHRSIPTNLCNLSHLQILDLSKNYITGNIPHCFGNLNAMSNMTSISQGISYDILGSFTTSSFTDKATLAWKGEYVEYSKNLRFMKTIDLSCNHLTGEIPNSIAALVALASLNLSRNHLKGSIPIEMGQMEKLESLDLSYNSLSGEIPISFSSLSFLSILNLAFNNSSGKIPTGTQLQSFNASSYTGNQGLCGPPLTERCPGDGSSDLNPNAHDIDTDGDDNLISFAFYVSMAFGFITGFWGVCETLILKKSWRHSFFHFFENMYNWIYVQVAILKAKIERRFHKD